MKLLSMTTLTGVLLSSSAFAGGLDRIYHPIAYMFEDGDYIEFAIARVKSDVTAPGNSPYPAVKENIINPYTQMAYNYKLDLNEKIALGLSVYNSIGADTLYPAALGGSYGRINALTTSVILKYKFTDDFSAYAGLKSLSASGGIKTSNSIVFDMARTQDFGGIIGGAYERREIALRVALTYETKIELEMDTKINGKTVPGAITMAGSAETFTLDFQTGIAKDTLVFGQIRHAKWGDANVKLNIVKEPFTNLTDVTSYELGIGRKLSEKLSMSVALGYEAAGPDSDKYSSLAPTNGRKAISIGAEYQATDRMKISAGIRYTKFGDATANSGIRFSDNDSIAVGLKIGFSL